MRITLLLSLVLVASCSSPLTTSNKPSPADADKFIADAEKRLTELTIKTSRADWVKSNFITDDTETLSADANKDSIAAVTELAEAAKKFDGVQLSTDTRAKAEAAQIAVDASSTKQSGGAGRVDEDCRIDGRRLRQGQILSERRQATL
jgi:peptidyl-dipeptidase A